MTKVLRLYTKLVAKIAAYLQEYPLHATYKNARSLRAILHFCIGRTSKVSGSL